MSPTWKKILTGAGVVAMITLLALVYDCGRKNGEHGLETAQENLERIKAESDSIANLPPRIVTVTDTIRPDPEVRWRTRYLDPPEDTTEPYLFRDSLVNDQVAFYVLDSVEGRIFWRDIGYKLFVPLEIKTTDSIFTNVPVIVDNPVPTYVNGWWIGGKVGGGSEFAYTVNLSRTQGRHQFGVEYLRFGPTNNWLVGYKYLIFQKN